MKFILHFTPTAKQALKELKENPGLKKRYKAVVKALKFLSEDPKHPSLQTHPYYSFLGPKGEKVFEAYVEQNTPAAYSIFSITDPTKTKLLFLQSHRILNLITIL